MQTIILRQTSEDPARQRVELGDRVGAQILQPDTGAPSTIDSSDLLGPMRTAFTCMLVVLFVIQFKPRAAYPERIPKIHYTSFEQLLKVLSNFTGKKRSICSSVANDEAKVTQ